MKILKHGDKYIGPKQFSCSGCNCLFIAEENEYVINRSFDYFNDCHIVFSTKCPDCGKQLNFYE